MYRALMFAVSFMLGGAGFVLMWLADWRVAVGLFLFLWGLRIAAAEQEELK